MMIVFVQLRLSALFARLRFGVSAVSAPSHRFGLHLVHWFEALLHRCGPGRVFTHASQHCPRDFNVFGVNSRKRVGDHLVRHRAQFLDERPCPCGDMKPPCPPVGRIGDSLDQPRFFQPVDDPRQGDRLDIEHVGKLDLPQPRTAASAGTAPSTGRA